MENLIPYLLAIPASLLSLSVHECCHGYAAYRMGDPTARNLGRLTLNPLKHLDPMGTLCAIFFHVGWARPVPINPRYFRSPRTGMAITAAAGPLSNLLLSFVGALLYLLMSPISQAVFSAFGITDFLLYFFYYLSLFFLIFHTLNLSLFIFNLIPLPPLDGSRIFYVFLPPKMYFGIMKYESLIQIILILALALGSFTGILSDFVSLLSGWMFSLLQLIPIFA